MGEPGGLMGAVVLDATGAVLGAVAAWRVDPDDHRPRWLDVTLADGTPVTLPVQAASADGHGRLVVPYTDADLRSAPRPDGPVVSTELAAALLQHYGFPPETR